MFFRCIDRFLNRFYTNNLFGISGNILCNCSGTGVQIVNHLIAFQISEFERFSI